MNTAINLPEVLRLHALWLNGDTTGQRADLSRANLSGANLSGANLYGANLSGANLYGANLSEADLSRADLSGANLSGANLSGANLYGANLSEADLSRADLSRANLSRANLYEANLSGANLYEADLYEANLSGANLYGAVLSEANLGFRSIVPAVGTFTAFKKLRHGTIAEVQIPGNAQRVGGLTGRKCRAEFVIVTNMFGATTDCSFYDPSVIYEVGSTITPLTWDNDVRIECAGGIHFFLSREEAEAYSF